MTAKELTGHIRELRADGEFFGSEDFLNLPDVPLRVMGVFTDDALKVGGKSAKGKPYLVLANVDGSPCRKKMLLNSGRRRALGAMYGEIIANWKGKIVWIYTDKVKNPDGGDQILGMKFRINTNEPATGSKQPKPIERDPLADYRDQLARCTTEAECRDLYERCGNPEVSGWTSEQDQQARDAMNERIAAMKGGVK